MSDRLIWIWLSLACGAGSRVYNRLFASFSTLREIYDAPRERFLLIDGVDDKTASALADKDMTRAREILSLCMRNNWGVLTYGDASYPKRLKSLIDPPVVLYCKGRFVDVNDNVCIAVVGTRRMTEYGERQAYRFSYAMASGGAVIVSGMALGCDAMAANGALDANMPTIAVLGCGIDVVYPKEHRTLEEHICKTGMVITEYPPGSKPEASHFPVRNRIISGLSQGTLVVEAPEMSGSLITARTALLQGRDLFAVPGEVGNENSSGGNALIKEGASAVTSAYDILCEYEYLYPHRISCEAAKHAEHSLARLGTASIGKDSAARRHIASRPQKKDGADGKPIKIAAADDGGRGGSFSFERDRQMIAEEARTQAERKVERRERKAEKPAGGDDNGGVGLPITKTEQAVLDAIGGRAVTPDELCELGFTAPEVMSALTILEILGRVTAVPGGRYVRSE